MESWKLQRVNATSEDSQRGRLSACWSPSAALLLRATFSPAAPVAVHGSVCSLHLAAGRAVPGHFPVLLLHHLVLAQPAGPLIPC